MEKIKVTSNTYLLQKAKRQNQATAHETAYAKQPEFQYKPYLMLKPYLFMSAKCQN